ncbi:MAG: S-methyl-5-thioribose-1-phosphate isomerase [Chloroflexota bacterium]
MTPIPLSYRTMHYANGTLQLLDQTRLPLDVSYVDCRQVDEVVEAVVSLRVRGAPAIGCAGAFGAVLAAERAAEAGLTGQALEDQLLADLDRLERARPTAVNLSWAIARMRGIAGALKGQPARAVVDALHREADAILLEDERANRAMGRLGAELLADGANILTHCNAGALATGSYGTALGVIRAAYEQGKRVHVWVDETRPLLQGARLTAWELKQLGIPHTLIADSMAGHFMARGRVDVVIVGADRIAANGDTANKIGTYSLAVLAYAHHIPFYVAAPSSTIDLTTASGDGIPIEERHPKEVLGFQTTRTAPDGTQVANPAFDVTPARLIHAIVTEKGIVRPPYGTAAGSLAVLGSPSLSKSMTPLVAAEGH